MRRRRQRQCAGADAGMGGAANRFTFTHGIQIDESLAALVAGNHALDRRQKAVAARARQQQHRAAVALG